MTVSRSITILSFFAVLVTCLPVGDTWSDFPNTIKDITVTVKYVYDRLHNVFSKFVNFDDFVAEGTRNSGVDFGEFRLCARHFADLSFGLMRREMWAIKMLDSWSKLPSGIMTGNVIDLGAFEECMNIKHDNQGFRGKYCLAKIILYYKNESTNPFRHVLLGGDTSVKLAYCVPSSCSASFLQYIVNDTITDLTKSLKVKVNVEIPSENCYTRMEKSESLTDTHWLVIFIVLLVLSAITLATFLDIYAGDSMSPYLAVFSFPRNFAKLFETGDEPDYFRVLYGLKFINMVWILLANRYQFFSEQPILNAFQTLALFKQWPTMVIFAAPLSSDTFLMISGFLNSYFSLKALNVGRSPFVGNFIFRYFRLTPSVLAMQAVTVLLLSRLGEGPLWNRVVTPEVDNCKNYWYTSLLFIGNYYNPNSLCLRQSWYLDINMQLTFLSPLLLYPLSKYPPVGKILLATCLAVSVLIPTYVSYSDMIPHPITISRNQSVVDYENRVSFVPTHMRLSSYLVGLACGYFVYCMKKTDRPIKLHGLRQILIWALSIICMSLAVFGGYWLYQIDYRYNRIYSSLYIGLHRILWSVGMACIIISSMSTKSGFVIKFLSSNFFVPLGKLSYSLYLVYLTVLLYEFGTTKTSFYYSLIGTVYHFCGDIVIDLILAFILCMSVEMPVTNMLLQVKSRLFGQA